MPADTQAVRTAVARLIVAGDFQELINLYAGGDVAATPETVARLYPPDALSAEDPRALEEVSAAIPDALLPPLDVRATAPAEMVELAARFALERGKGSLAVRALREAEALERAYRSCLSQALESLEAGDDARAAFALSLAARLGWAGTSPEARREFIVGLGVHPGELASSVGAESVRGRISGGRALPDFPAWQSYGPLFHARCHVGPCLSDLPLEASVPLAARFLLHGTELADRATAAAGDARRLLRLLAAELDPTLDEFAQRHAEAMARYRELHDEGLIRDTRMAAETREEPDAGPAEESADEPLEEDVPTEDTPEEGTEPEAADDTPPDKAEAARRGLHEVQALLLGRPEKEWRNALAELAATHPLSVFTVCTVRGGELGTFVIPAGERATEFLRAVIPDAGT